ncbi:MAG: hypothetical protein ACLP50_13445 [Solirubrobacteraceae bacterium]
MADCTTPSRLRLRPAAVVLAAIALLGVTTMLVPARARADGDPASDVLATQPSFIPADGGLSDTEQARLQAAVTAALHSGFPVRVALIATQSDLGSVTPLWGMPASYAQFLGTELSLVFHGTLLVVMPDGFGVAAVGTASGPTLSTLSALRAPGSALGPAAVTAVQRLAAAAGHPLAVPVTSAPAVASPGSALGSVDLGSWLALVAGALMIASAWTLSLRARPARRPWGPRSHG